MPSNSRTFLPMRALVAARNDLGLQSGRGRCQQFTEWQTRGQIRCSPFCASATSMWLSEGGYVFDADEHVWGDRGDWNVTALRVWAQKHGFWRSDMAHMQPGWLVVMNFSMVDQHIGIGAAQAMAGQPVATIEGNTSGGQVLAKSRGLNVVQGFIDTYSQLASNTPSPTPPEVRKMGQVAACQVPGARAQTAGPTKGRTPAVDAFQDSDGSWALRGANGTVLKEATVNAAGVSAVKLGKLNSPITSIEASRDDQGNWKDKAIVAIAGDFGTFAVHVAKINYDT